MGQYVSTTVAPNDKSVSPANAVVTINNASTLDQASRIDDYVPGTVPPQETCPVEVITAVDLPPSVLSPTPIAAAPAPIPLVEQPIVQVIQPLSAPVGMREEAPISSPNPNNPVSSGYPAPSVPAPVLEIKFCPRCGVATDKISGCNFMDCRVGDRSYLQALPGKQLKPEDICTQLWCFECGRPKYQTIEGREYLGSCNDISHNSH